eukprot:NODE_1714_length_1405_cov_15.884977_g1628_i0.p1 GENE.NODE_1714_length_1405_cov_15.884977_g1628_i0~~NODE_1714_length_1405_cov_15.884977_g1628_i0.p1  ORF type:complete len:280 (-),score=56.57 NODE_1714_length_1405_cov_15.884977_g1628_i0:80-919(-)
MIGQFVAVKVIDMTHLTNQKQVEQLASEISFMKEYKHPHIVGYYGSEIDRTENALNIFMEYTPGGSLSSLIVKSHAGCIEDQTLIVHFCRQILQGLAYLHENGIVHRDIKGDNILITEAGSAKLADFGCSKRIGQITLTDEAATNSFVGTPFWMAPEVIIDNAGFDVKADVWSLGCTVVECLTGKPPWQDKFKTIWAAIYHIAQSTDSPTGIPEHLPLPCSDFLDQCFRRDVTCRPSAAELLHHPWLSVPTTTCAIFAQHLRHQPLPMKCNKMPLGPVV